ncbi:hypothetical protein SteCoe_1496 [Stentor coeruleus]|uniref:Uncharacterized protein n=1 Tax=Stentor coeruleus TaxID=5963 RepID=A0A1R2D1K8_9CILI|nr:hypothetical protein SteCoe_1496 [Stentor coeruleus]
MNYHIVHKLPFKIFLIQYIAMEINYNELSYCSQASFQNIPDSVYCHGAYYKKLECGHPYCTECFAIEFRKIFQEFLTALNDSNIEELSCKSFGINCPNEDCNNKYCCPFIIFKSIALEMLGTWEYKEIFCEHYSLMFEGIKMRFVHCKNCKYAFGYIGDNAKCIYCGQWN